MIIGFKKQFVAPILAGTKVHTIRENKTNRWRPGTTIQFATGVRTKQYSQFKLNKCVSIQSIQIRRYEGKALFFSTIKIDGQFVAPPGWLALAVNDGFAGLDDFFEWFNKDFDGTIIHWTNLKY